MLQIAVRNGTGKTFTAADGLTVRVPGFTGTRHVPGNALPVLTGDEVWKPKTWIVFYILSKKYYPMSPQVAAGFQLQVGGRSSTLVPGPSAIFLRLKYDPATFASTLDWIVAYGQGAQLRHGIEDRHARHGHQRARLGGDQSHGLRRPLLIGRRTPAARIPTARPRVIPVAPGRAVSLRHRRGLSVTARGRRLENLRWTTRTSHNPDHRD